MKAIETGRAANGKDRGSGPGHPRQKEKTIEDSEKGFKSSMITGCSSSRVSKRMGVVERLDLHSDFHLSVRIPVRP